MAPRSNQRSSSVFGLWLGLLLYSIAGCAKPAEDEVLVFAAASLRDMATELGEAFERESGTRVIFNFAGSNVLAQQILAAPRADLFLSADRAWIDFLVQQKCALAEPSRAFLRNRLVLVGDRDSLGPLAQPSELADLDFRFLALANPEAVPAGRYAKQWLSAIPYASGTLWDALAERIIATSDVRAALALVESEPMAIGIVYASDVHSRSKPQVLLEPRPQTQLSIQYGAVLLDQRPASPNARSLFQYLFSDQAADLYLRHGFLPSPE